MTNFESLYLVMAELVRRGYEFHVVYERDNDRQASRYMLQCIVGTERWDIDTKNAAEIEDFYIMLTTEH